MEYFQETRMIYLKKHQISSKAKGFMDTQKGKLPEGAKAEAKKADKESSEVVRDNLSLVERICSLYADLRSFKKMTESNKGMTKEDKEKMIKMMSKHRKQIAKHHEKVITLLKKEGKDLDLTDKRHRDKFGLPNNEWLKKFKVLNKLEQMLTLEHSLNKAASSELSKFWDEFIKMFLDKSGDFDFNVFIDTYRKKYQRK